ncbi:MAG: hypothetical protein RLZZ224_2005, partial [Verrucomicrobiota bacterium]
EDAKASAESADPWVSATASAGFDSSYYFRGLWFSNNNFWGGVNLSAPITDKLTFGLGALYTETAHTTIKGADDNLRYSEYDLIGSLSYETDFATFGLVLTNYHFPDTFSGELDNETTGTVDDAVVKNAFDIGLTAMKSIGSFNLYLGSWFDTKIDGWYYEAGVDYTYAVTDKLSLVPVVQMGYAIDYYTFNSSDNEGLTHIRAAINAPYKVTDSLTVSAYGAYNIPLETRKGINVNETRNDPYCGVSATYAF